MDTAIGKDAAMDAVVAAFIASNGVIVAGKVEEDAITNVVAGCIASNVIVAGIVKVDTVVIVAGYIASNVIVA